VRRMSSGMHEGELTVDDHLVRRLVDRQFPQWRGLPLRRLPPLGTDNQLVRLGEELLVRLPRIDWAAQAPAREYAWLPWLAPQLPLPVPAPVALGRPDLDYPFEWTVVPWFEGEPVTARHLGGADDNVAWEPLAHELAAFLVRLRTIDASKAPVRPDGARGSSLGSCDEWVREWTTRAGERVNGAAVLDAWEESLSAPGPSGPPAWVHGDVHEGNVLVRAGRVSAVIDWGSLGAGDPAVELNAAWGFLPPQAAGTFRAAMGLDHAAWLRGRGWALVPAISGLVYYERTAPQFARRSLATLERILAETAS
jgi:aminoglycoside phosphotransferase (APT) family kinase protein